MGPDNGMKFFTSREISSSSRPHLSSRLSLSRETFLTALAALAGGGIRKEHTRIVSIRSYTLSPFNTIRSRIVYRCRRYHMIYITSILVLLVLLVVVLHIHMLVLLVHLYFYYIYYIYICLYTCILWYLHSLHTLALHILTLHTLFLDYTMFLH